MLQRFPSQDPETFALCKTSRDPGESDGFETHTALAFHHQLLPFHFPDRNVLYGTLPSFFSHLWHKITIEGAPRTQKLNSTQDIALQTRCSDI